MTEAGASRSRSRLLIVVPVVAVLLGGGGLVASAFIRSPEEQRADAAPPAATVLTAPVERRILNSTMVTRGTVVAAGQVNVTPVVEGAAAQVVTALHVKAGDTVKKGQVLAAISGRPLYVLPGNLPGYRDLKPGDSGSDIEQLQKALRALGDYRGGDDTGYFGSATKTAVRRFYADSGYDVPQTDRAGGRTDATTIADSEDAVDEAADAVVDVDAQLAVAGLAATERASLKRQRVRLVKHLQRARDTHRTLVATTGPMVPHSEYVFVSSFPARVSMVSAKVGEAVADPFLTLAVGKLAVSVKIRADQVDLVRPGMAVKISSEALGKEADGTVGTVGALVNDPKGEEPAYHPMTVELTRKLDATWSDLDVRVSVVAAETTEKVLVVPVSAVSAAADGRTTVSVVSDGGGATRVEVRVGVSGDGYVEVEAVSGTLSENDEVVVGKS